LLGYSGKLVISLDFLAAKESDGFCTGRDEWYVRGIGFVTGSTEAAELGRGLDLGDARY
jgi:hypothetical protein